MGSNVLRRKRGEKQMQIQDLAKLAGVNVNTIYYLENNYQTAKAETIGKLAAALGCSYADLAELENQPILNQRKRYPKNKALAAVA